MLNNLRRRLVGDLIASEVEQQTAELTAEIARLKKVRAMPITDDTPGFTRISGDAPVTEDRSFTEWQRDVKASLDAWRKNFMARRIVTLTSDYVVGDSIKIMSKIPDVQQFIDEWWNHPLNRMSLRLHGMCNELTRSGELYPVLFPHDVKGFPYIRFIPARQIDEIRTNQDDIEHELGYHRLPNAFQLKGKWWRSRYSRENGEPFMLHYAINRAIGAKRGEGDLVPILPWLRRYTGWLQDRVRLNKARTQGGAWIVTIKDSTELETKQKQYSGKKLEHGAIVVKGPDESWDTKELNISAHSARDDGKALRLAIASGVGYPLHYFSEGESATKGTAGEMNAPTFRHFRTRQLEFCFFLMDIVEQAYRASDRPAHDNLQLKATTPDIEPQDNKLLAEAAKYMVETLAQMKAEGWVSDELAIKIAFKFAGEILDEEEIEKILSGKE
jgi:hypothetical protein